MAASLSVRYPFQSPLCTHLDFTFADLLLDNLKKTICYLLPAGSFSELCKPTYCSRFIDTHLMLTFCKGPVLANTFLGIPQALSSFLMVCSSVLYIKRKKKENSEC